MFTSEPSLTQRIGRMIGDTTIIDPQTRIDCRRPGASDLAALIREPHLQGDLAAVGMPSADLDPTLPADEQVRRALPYLRPCRNTANAWCLYRIFRDLYDFDEPHLDLANYRDLFDKVAASGQDPDWARSILLQRSRVARVITTSDHRESAPSRLPEHVDFAIDARGLIPSAIPIGRSYVESIAPIVGDTPGSYEDLERLIFDWLDRAITPSIRFASIPLFAGPPLASLEPAALEGLWDRLSSGQRLSAEEGEALTLGVVRSILRWHDDGRRLIRIDAPIPTPGGMVSQERSRLLKTLLDLARTFGNARLDVMVGSAISPHQLSAIAGRLPNVFASGIPWQNASATSIAQALGHRIQAAPASKFIAFSSDGPSVEWVYGRLQLAKKAMGSALGRLIEDGFFEEDEIPPLIRQVLHDTPRRLYGWSDC